MFLAERVGWLQGNKSYKTTITKMTMKMMIASMTATMMTPKKQNKMRDENNPRSQNGLKNDPQYKN